MNHEQGKTLGILIKPIEHENRNCTVDVVMNDEYWYSMNSPKAKVAKVQGFLF